MNQHITQLIEKIRQLEDELEIEFARRRTELSFSIHNQKVIFEQAVVHHHQQFKIKLSSYIFHAHLKVLVTAPFIYALIIPFLLLDVMVSLYQWICFPVYGINKVNRASYFIYDRRHLVYLNAIEKINCAYCSYGNGLIAYVREVAARTERYWCPIKHAERSKATHNHYAHFFDYGDAESYHDYLAKQQSMNLKEKNLDKNR